MAARCAAAGRAARRTPGAPARRGEAGGGGVQAAALRDDDGHDQRRTGAPVDSGCRKRSMRSSPPTIRHDGERAAPLERIGDAGLDGAVALTGPPGGQRLL